MNVYPINSNYQKLYYKRLVNQDLSVEENENLKQFSIHEMIENEASIIKNKELERDAVLNVIEGLKEKVAKLNSFIDTAKINLRHTLITHSIDKLKTPYFEVKIAQNVSSTEILDESAIPPEYFISKTVTSLNRQQILTDMRNGIAVPGATLKQETRVSIK